MTMQFSENNIYVYFIVFFLIIFFLAEFDTFEI